MSSSISISSDSKIARSEHCAYCYDMLLAELLNLPSQFDWTTLHLGHAKMPVFVTWYKRSTRKKYDELRGCLGTFSQELPIRIGLKKYSVMSAINDKRFEPVTIAELYQLTCSISLLHSFTRATKWVDWELGVHGITIQFTDGAGKSYNATYLPEVPGQQKWNKLTTIENLVSKAGFHGSAAQVHNLSVTRYQSCKYVMTWPQYLVYTTQSSSALSNRVRLLQTCSTPQLYHALVNGDAVFYSSNAPEPSPSYDEEQEEEDELPPSASSSSSSSLALQSPKSSKPKNVNSNRNSKQLPKQMLQSQNKKIVKQSLAAHHNKTKVKTLSMPKFGKTKIKSTAKRLFRYGSKKLSSSPPPPQKHSNSHHHHHKTDDHHRRDRTHHRHHTHPSSSAHRRQDASPSPSDGHSNSRSASISKRLDSASLRSPQNRSPSPFRSYSSHRHKQHDDDDDEQMKMKKRVRGTDDEDAEENDEDDEVDESELDEDEDDDDDDAKSESSSPSPLVTLENAHRSSAKIRIHRPTGNNSSDEQPSARAPKSKTHSAVSTDSDTRSQPIPSHKPGSMQQLLLTHNMQMDGSSSSLLSAHSHRSQSMTTSSTTTPDDAQRKYKPLQKFHPLKISYGDEDADDVDDGRKYKNKKRKTPPPAAETDFKNKNMHLLPVEDDDGRLGTPSLSSQSGNDYEYDDEDDDGDQGGVYANTRMKRRAQMSFDRDDDEEEADEHDDNDHDNVNDMAADAAISDEFLLYSKQ